MKKKVLFRAPALSASGYGVAARQIFRWLISREEFDVRVDLLKWGNTPWMINENMEDGLIGEIMKRSQAMKEGEVFDISFQLQLPNEWNPSLAKINIGMSAFVETDKCNPAWLECCNKMDAIVVPSQHAANCIANSGGIATPLAVIPESYHDEIALADLPQLDLGLKTNFNFLVFGQLTANNADSDRKNIYNTIKWLCEEFKDDEDVGIVLKTNMSRNTKMDKEFTKKMVNSVLHSVKKGKYPKVHLLHGSMSKKEVASLYRHDKIKALVLLTRGEGFGLPILEAAASGLPIVTTNWSGHLDFLSKGKFIPVNYSLKEIPKNRVDGQIFIPGARWAEPVEADAKMKLRKFRKKPSLPKEWAEELKGKIIKEYSQAKICEMYDMIFSDLLNQK